MEKKTQEHNAKNDREPVSDETLVAPSVACLPKTGWIEVACHQSHRSSHRAATWERGVHHQNMKSSLCYYGVYIEVGLK